MILANWYNLFKTANDYDQYRDRIDELSHQNPNPFSDWFDNNGRSYFPLNDVEESGFDPDVVSELEEKGCQVTDYRGGYCQTGNRTNKIGKMLQNIWNQAIRKLDEKNQAGQVYNYDRDAEDINRYYQELIYTFNNSSWRSNQGSNQMMVVVSQDPHDIASMSTGRNWTSCMELGTGAHHKDVYCEVSSGGLIAYLIYANDQEIQRPLARVHIRRFDNKDGQSIAIPEESVYGNEVPSFIPAVKAWIAEKQNQDMTPGWYSRQGGEYSDTFNSGLLAGPTNQKDVITWLRGEDPSAVYTEYSVEDQLYTELSDYLETNSILEETGEDFDDYSRKFKTREEAEEYLRLSKMTETDEWERERADEFMGLEGIDDEGWSEIDEETGYWKNQRFHLRENKKDYRDDMKNEAIKTIIRSKPGEYPEEIIAEVRDKLFDPNTPIRYSDRRNNLRLEFAKKHFQSLSQEQRKMLDDGSMRSVMTEMPEGMDKDQYRQTIMEDVNSILDDPENPIIFDKEYQRRKNERLLDTHDNKTREISREDGASQMASINFSKYIADPLTNFFDHLPEPIIQKLIHFSQNIREYADQSSLPPQKNNWHRMLASIAHVFSMTNADTPSVQRYYSSLLPLWGNRTQGVHRNGSPDDDHPLPYSIINVDTLGYPIANLGPQNGRDFIPFIQDKLNQSIENYKELEQHIQEKGSWNAKAELAQADKTTEKLYYILEQLQTGQASGKYKWSKSNNWYTSLK